MDAETVSKLVAALSLGADRAVAARYVGLSLAELEQLLAEHDDVLREVLRAEATAELAHLRTVKEAASQAKNWRASVFWLKSRRPDTYGKKPQTVTESELSAFADQFYALLRKVLSADDYARVEKELAELLAA